jgi:hypothetical protein
MGWDDRFRDLVEDLAQQAAGWRLAERDAEVAELSRAEYAEVELSARLRGSVGAPLVVDVLGVGPVDGRLHRVGQGWMLLAGETHDWVVATAAVAAACSTAITFASACRTCVAKSSLTMRSVAGSHPICPEMNSVRVPSAAIAFA